MTTTANPQATRPVVALDGLTKRYGSIAAVEDLSFEVPARQVTGLLGPNGAGKTTAMKMLLGLIRPTSGIATVLGADHNTPEFNHAVRRVGGLVEAPAIYERLSARQNLELQARALGTSRDAGRLDELLELVDLADRADDKARKYSLGMKQRLGIAIAMIGSPELLILDEPANGLDPAGIADMRQLLRRLPEEHNTAVLVSSHQLAEVQAASDRLVILANGRLVTQGTTEEILAGHRSQDFTIRLEPADLAPATVALSRHSLTVRPTAPDQLTVTLPDSWTGRDLNRSLVEADVFAAELTHDTVSLEAAFLDMTAATPANPPASIPVGASK